MNGLVIIKKQYILSIMLLIAHICFSSTPSALKSFASSEQTISADASFEFENVTNSTNYQSSSVKGHRQKKSWTFITYMAADNDLAPFARRNLKQQADIGSTDYINIVTQLDTKTGTKKITKRYYIEKDRLVVTNQRDSDVQYMDSGNPNTLIDCCKWAIENYPADHYALIFWNHGTGILDIGPKKLINPLPLFLFNPESNLIELDRSIPFLDYIQATTFADQRAICFDDSTGHYLSNKDLENALNTICANFLHGKKFDIICFDACLMSMLEVANITKNYARYMVSSQEVELGTGYDYRKILAPFCEKTLKPKHFARHIVFCYENTYGAVTSDYTQSAIKLKQLDLLEENVSLVATLLQQCIKAQRNKSVSEAIKASKHKLFCTHFDEPSYIDLHHFYCNLTANLKRFNLEATTNNVKLVEKLRQSINEGMQLIKKLVIANVAGKNLSMATGISIYFPDKKIHTPYLGTPFSKTNQWPQLISTYLAQA